MSHAARRIASQQSTGHALLIVCQSKFRDLRTDVGDVGRADSADHISSPALQDAQLDEVVVGEP